MINSTSLGMGAKVPFNTLVLSLDKLKEDGDRLRHCLQAARHGALKEREA